MNHGNSTLNPDKFTKLPSINLALGKGRDDIARVLLQVLQRIIPSEEETRRVESFADKVVLTLKKALDDLNIDCIVEIEGSVAKKTWISRAVDFDIFILLPPPETKDYKPMLKNLLHQLMKKIPWKSQIRYAEHPYLHIWINNFEVDIVPAFRSPPDNIISAVDRTPHHTRYVCSRLSEELRNEVRLLKSFLKGINAYGAEIKTGGFSGYSCELLIIHYGSFLRTIEEFSKRRRIFVDLTDSWKPREAFKKFSHFFILIDPVDRNRNVTSALREDTFSYTQLLSKLFLLKPSVKFFFPQAPQREIPEILDILSKRKIHLVVLRKRKDVPPDVYWGQAMKILRRIERVVRNTDYKLIHIDAIDGKNSMILLIETVFDTTPTPRKLIGPPTYANIDDIISFINKHKKESIAGPWIENWRIVFLIKTAKSLEEFLRNYVTTIRLDPSFDKFEVIHDLAEVKRVLDEEGVLLEFYEKIMRRKIIDLIE